MADLLLLVPLALCLFGLRPVKGLNIDCLSKKGTDALRGILALGILFVHITQYCPGGVLFDLWGKIGYLLVALFFFLTGYGLQKQHMTRKDYHKGFLTRRLMGVLLPYLVITAVYWSYYRLLGRGYGLWDVLKLFAEGTPIVSFSWFVPAVLTFYLAFWALMRLCGKGYSTMVLGAAVWFSLYTVICLALGWGNWWYISAFPVVIGMAWATYGEAIEKALKKRYILWFVLTVAGLAGALILENSLHAGFADTLVKGCAATLFTLAVVLAVYKVRFGNPVLRLLGQLSMEIYLMQGLAIMVLRSRWIYVESPVLYGGLIVVLTVAFAAVVHIAFKGIPKKPTR